MLKIASVDLSRSNFSIARTPLFQLKSAYAYRESGLSETAHSPSKHKDKHGFVISQCKHTEL